MGTRRPDRSWLEVAREAALQQATLEARYQWEVGPRALPPFNYRFEHIQAVVQIATQLAEVMKA